MSVIVPSFHSVSYDFLGISLNLLNPNILKSWLLLTRTATEHFYNTFTLLYLVNLLINFTAALNPENLESISKFED